MLKESVVGEHEKEEEGQREGLGEDMIGVDVDAEGWLMLFFFKRLLLLFIFIVMYK
jgi:hypothetical protein